MSLCVDDLLVCRFGWSSIQTCIPEGHLHRVTYTRRHIDTINSSDDGNIAVRNTQRIEINIHGKEFYVKLFIYKDYNEMYHQQNIKFFKYLFQYRLSSVPIFEFWCLMLCFLDILLNSQFLFSASRSGVLTLLLPLFLQSSSNLLNMYYGWCFLSIKCAAVYGSYIFL